MLEPEEPVPLTAIASTAKRSSAVASLVSPSSPGEGAHGPAAMTDAIVSSDCRGLIKAATNLR